MRGRDRVFGMNDRALESGPAKLRSTVDSTRLGHRWLLLLVVIVLTVGVLIGVRAEDRQPGPHGPRGAWTSSVNEDFHGTLLDRRIWQPNRFGTTGGDAPFVPLKESAWFSASNVEVTGGELSLVLRREPKTLEGKTYRYSSGVVQSIPGVTVEPEAYVEARILVPRCDGCWPAFWLVPTDTWPPEIDIFEFFDTGKPSESRPSFNYIRPSGSQSGPTMYGPLTIDYRQEYHTYGVLWEEDRITPYVDGVAYPDAGATRYVTDREQRIILNLSVMAGHHPASGSRMLVDWVRVWVPEEVGAAVAPDAADPGLPRSAIPGPARLTGRRVTSG